MAFVALRLGHDPERWAPVFRKDHAQRIGWSAMTTHPDKRAERACGGFHGLAAGTPSELLLFAAVGDPRQGPAQRREMDRLGYRRANIEVKKVTDLDRLVAYLFARGADDDDRCPALDLRKQLQDLDARVLAERQAKRDAVERPLGQQLAGFGDRVSAGGPEAHLLRYLAKDRQMKVGILNDEKFVAHAACPAADLTRLSWRHLTWHARMSPQNCLGSFRERGSTLA